MRTSATSLRTVENHRCAPSLMTDMTDLLEELLIELRRAEVASSFALGVSRRTAVGFTRITSYLGCGAESWFDLASLTKPALAFLVSDLNVRGAMSLDAPLETYLAEARCSRAGRATLRMHLAHRAPLQAHVRFFREAAAGCPLRRQQVLREALAATRQEGASSGPLYSDLGYLLVGEAVERRLGAPLDGTLSDCLAEYGCRSPLLSARQIRATRSDREFVPTEFQMDRGGLLRGAVHDDNAWFWAGAGTAGHAGLFGQLSGVLEFTELLLRGISSANEASVRLRDTTAALTARYADGTFRMGLDGVSPTGSSAGNLVGPNAVGHLGFTGTSFWIDPDRGAVVVLLTNRVTRGWDATKIRWARRYVHDRVWAWLDGEPQ